MIRVVPLGGLGEIGLNAMAFEVGAERVLVDAGLMFPPAGMPSAEIVLPDLQFVLQDRERLKAVLLTHGHEDHIGAVPYLLRELSVPVYGTPLTLALLRAKLEEAQVRADLRELHPREQVRLSGTMTVEPIQVAHSMPDAVGFALTTPEGTFLHTGDFKIDQTPLDGRPTDVQRLAELGDRGVRCLFSDSTNAELEKDTPSESVVARCFDRLFAQAPGRVIVTMFASHLLRVGHVLALSERLGRRVALLGRSLQRNVELAERTGHLRVPNGLLISAEAAAGLPPQQVTLLTTGAQAEPRSALSQLLTDSRGLQVRVGDTVLLSARAIPGNERSVAALIDSLLERGAFVRYAAIEPEIHVSGHASRGHQRRMIELVRPQSFVPVHGELHHLVAHADLARGSGISERGILLARDGDVLRFEGDAAVRDGQVPVGRHFTTRETGATIARETLEDRTLLNLTGAVAAAVVVDRATLRYVSGPHLTGRGLTPAEELHLADAAQDVRLLLEEISPALRSDQAFLREELTRAVRRAFKQRFGRKPAVAPLVIQL